MRNERQLENRQFEPANERKSNEEDEDARSSLHEEKTSSLDQLLSKAIRDKNGLKDNTGNSAAFYENWIKDTNLKVSDGEQEFYFLEILHNADIYCAHIYSTYAPKHILYTSTHTQTHTPTHAHLGCNNGGNSRSLFLPCIGTEQK